VIVSLLTLLCVVVLLFRCGKCGGVPTIHNLEEIMSALDDLKAKADALSAEIATANAKADSVIAALVSVKAKLDALTGSTVTDADLQAVVGTLDAALQSVKGQEAKDDAAVA
jgi:hypothetical protein